MWSYREPSKGLGENGEAESKKGDSLALGAVMRDDGQAQGSEHAYLVPVLQGTSSEAISTRRERESMKGSSERWITLSE